MKKNILITGATKGMGRAVAFALAEAGNNLVLHYNSDLAAAKSLQAELVQYPIAVHLVQANFADGLKEINKLFDEAL